MLVDVEYTCPECGKVWSMKMEDGDKWYRFGAKDYLCAECGERAIRKLLKDLDERLEKEKPRNEKK